MIGDDSFELIMTSVIYDKSLKKCLTMNYKIGLLVYQIFIL